jgi:hypothetical protein
MSRWAPKRFGSNKPVTAPTIVQELNYNRWRLNGQLARVIALLAHTIEAHEDMPRKPFDAAIAAIEAQQRKYHDEYMLKRGVELAKLGKVPDKAKLRGEKKLDENGRPIQWQKVGSAADLTKVVKGGVKSVAKVRGGNRGTA